METKIGGRPRNAWTSSRKRKLIRLYSLTTLSVKEIVEVLKDYDFDPCARDVQKKLRDLFPRDYTKHYKSFRPPKDRSRSFRIEKLLPNRHAPTKRSSIGVCHLSTGFTRTVLSQDHLNAFEGPLHAFRGYSGSANVYAPYSILDGSQDEPQSQIVIPSRLLLDGSSILGQPASRSGAEQSAPVNTHCQREIVDEQKNYTQVGLSGHESAISLASINKRLQRSGSFIRHLHSVLRLSSTNSWRSSMSFLSISLSSEEGEQAQSNTFAKLDSGHTKASYIQTQSSNQMRTLSEQTGLVDPDVASGRLISKTHARSELETFAWGELARNKTWNRSPGQGRHRVCCYNITSPNFLCTICGRNSNHLMALKGQVPLIDNIKDHYANTSLHFAAGSPAASCTQLSSMIKAGADPNSVNTSGETFLHILFSRVSLKTLPSWASFLQHLREVSFSFSTRDCHGQTILHILGSQLRDRDHFPYDPKKVLPVLNIMNLNLDAMDNGGITIHDRLQGLLLKDLPTSTATTLFDYPYSSRITGPTFVGSLSNFDHDLVMWMEWLSKTDAYSSIDSAGDTPILALLKSFPSDGDSVRLEAAIGTLSDSGTSIHMRDRNGETPLAIAAQRAFRPLVSKLVKMGASLHCRNYFGTSILQKVRENIRSATREENDPLYAKLVSTATLLVDMGACNDPAEYQEWAIPSSPLASGRRAS